MRHFSLFIKDIIKFINLKSGLIYLVFLLFLLILSNNSNKNLIGGGFNSLQDGPSISSLTDVQLVGLAANEVLQYDGDYWVNATINAGTLNDISDVSTSSPTNYGDLLMWSGSNWSNTATSTLGIAGSGTVNSGTTGQIPYYAADGTALTGTSSFYIDSTGKVTQTYASGTAATFTNIYGTNLTVTYASTTALTSTNFYGTWSGNAIGVTKGGTGLTAIAAGGLLYGSAANTLSVLASSTAGKVLKIGSTGFPEWGDESVKTAGDYLTLTSQDMDIDTEVVTKAFEFVIATTTIATTSNYLSFQVPVALNITQVSGFCNGGTTTVAIDERAATTPKTAGSDIFDSAFSIGDYKATTTFSNADIASGAWVNLDIDGYFVGTPILCYLNIKGVVVD